LHEGSGVCLIFSHFWWKKIREKGHRRKKGGIVKAQAIFHRCLLKRIDDLHGKTSPD
jgi:hypothetical protein